MRPRDPAALQAITRGHTRTVRAVILPAGDVVDLTTAGDLQWSLEDGVTRRGGTIVVPETVAPAVPLDASVRLTCTIDGTHEFDLGDFAVVGVSARRPGGDVTLTLGDWMLRLGRTRIDAWRYYAWGTPAAICGYFFNRALPFVPEIRRDDSDGRTRTVAIPYGGNLLEALEHMTRTLGVTAIIVDREHFDLIAHTDDVAEIIPAGAIVRRDSGLDTTGDFANRVVITIEDDATARRYTAERVVTAGPFKWGTAGIGKADYIPEVEIVENATQADADRMADLAFDAYRGVERTLPLEVIPMPWLEVGDVVEFPSSPTGQSERFQIRSIRLPIGPGTAMALEGRDRTEWQYPLSGAGRW